MRGNTKRNAARSRPNASLVEPDGPREETKPTRADFSDAARSSSVRLLRGGGSAHECAGTDREREERSSALQDDTNARRNPVTVARL